MINIQDFIGSSNLFKKLEVDKLLFVEIICPVEEDESADRLWWHDNFFSYAIAGKMILKTLHHEYTFEAGNCIFSKKGTVISARHLIQEDFCELRIFVPDDFIKSVFRKHQLSFFDKTINDITDTLIPLASDEVLDIYFHSLLTYFRQSTPPPGNLLKLKFEELVVNILSNKKHQSLQCFFNELCRYSKPSISEIMEANFFSNLSLSEFARLCGRSLSSFKLEFATIFNTTPGRWLQNKRLDYSRHLLESTDLSIDEICVSTGFENRSHFIRVFKNKYGLTPGKFHAVSH